MNGWLLYLILQLDVIRMGLALSISMMVVFLGAFIFYWWVESDTWNGKGEKPTFGNALKKYPIIPVGYFLIFFSFISIFLPSTKNALLIWGIPKIVNNQQIQITSKNLLKLVNQKINEVETDTK